MFNAFGYAGTRLSIDEIDLFTGANFLVTVIRHDPADGCILADLERVVTADFESARHGPAFLMHVILDYVVDQKFVAIERLEDELDAAEDSILCDLSAFVPSELMRLRRDLLTFR